MGLKGMPDLRATKAFLEDFGLPDASELNSVHVYRGSGAAAYSLVLQERLQVETLSDIDLLNTSAPTATPRTMYRDGCCGQDVESYFA